MEPYEWRKIGSYEFGYDKNGNRIPGAIRSVDSGTKKEFDAPDIKGLIWNAKGYYQTQSGRRLTDQEVDAAIKSGSGGNTSYSVSQSYQDPAAIQMQRDELRQQGEIAQRNYDLAVRKDDRESAQWWQTRLDNLSARVQDLGLRREELDFRREDSTANRGQQWADSEANRALRREELGYTQANSAEERALRAAEFAMTHGLNENRYGTEIDQFNVNAERQWIADQRDAAKQLSDVISQVDPAAYEAYNLGLGRGAIDDPRGATALSDRAMLPAAKTLRSIDRLAAGPPKLSRPQPMDMTPYLERASRPFPQMAAGVAPRLSTPPPQPQQLATGFMAGQAQDTPATAAQTVAIAANPSNPFSGFAQIAAQQGQTLGQFAHGTGWIDAPDYSILGDSPMGGVSGFEEMLQVKDPPGPNNAQIRVTPNHRLPAGVLSRSPRFAYGTIDAASSGMADPNITPEDQPYLDQVRQLRERIQVPNLNPWSTKFALEDPMMQQRYFAARQSKLGIPIASQMAAQQRYRVPALSRGAYRLGY